MYVRNAVSAFTTLASLYFAAVMIHVGDVIGYVVSPSAFSGL